MLFLILYRKPGSIRGTKRKWCVAYLLSKRSILFLLYYAEKLKKWYCYLPVLFLGIGLLFVVPTMINNFIQIKQRVNAIKKLK